MSQCHIRNSHYGTTHLKAPVHHIHRKQRIITVKDFLVLTQYKIVALTHHISCRQIQLVWDADVTTGSTCSRCRQVFDAKRDHFATICTFSNIIKQCVLFIPVFTYMLSNSLILMVIYRYIGNLDRCSTQFCNSHYHLVPGTDNFGWETIFSIFMQDKECHCTILLPKLWALNIHCTITTKLSQ